MKPSKTGSPRRKRRRFALPKCLRRFAALAFHLSAYESKLSTFLKTKKAPKAPFCSYSAGKEGQISNRFKEDLVQITDFLQVNKKEISMILKEI